MHSEVKRDRVPVIHHAHESVELLSNHLATETREIANLVARVNKTTRFAKKKAGEFIEKIQRGASAQKENECGTDEKVAHTRC